MSTAAGRAADFTMDLLHTVQRDALEPEYRRHRDEHTAQRAAGGVRRARVGAVGLALVATLLTMAAVQTGRQAPATATERAELVRQVTAVQQAQAARRRQVAELNAEVLRLQAAQVPAAGEITPLAAQSGQSAVTGPGILVVVDDPKDADAGSPQVGQQDLRQLVNGLWSAGAEAVAINGHRVTARTAIRDAGSAITADYVSLTPPYSVQAIGNPDTLADDFAASAGGRWWSFLHTNYGMVYEVTQVDRLRLPGDVSLAASLARVAR